MSETFEILRESVGKILWKQRKVLSALMKGEKVVELTISVPLTFKIIQGVEIYTPTLKDSIVFLNEMLKEKIRIAIEKKIRSEEYLKNIGGNCSNIKMISFDVRPSAEKYQYEVIFKEELHEQNY